MQVVDSSRFAKTISDSIKVPGKIKKKTPLKNKNRKKIEVSE